MHPYRVVLAVLLLAVAGGLLADIAEAKDPRDVHKEKKKDRNRKKSKEESNGGSAGSGKATKKSTSVKFLNKKKGKPQRSSALWNVSRALTATPRTRQSPSYRSRRPTNRSFRGRQ